MVLVNPWVKVIWPPKELWPTDWEPLPQPVWLSGYSINLWIKGTKCAPIKKVYIQVKVWFKSRACILVAGSSLAQTLVGWGLLKKKKQIKRLKRSSQTPIQVGTASSTSLTYFHVASNRTDSVTGNFLFMSQPMTKGLQVGPWACGAAGPCTARAVVCPVV